jgi:transcriptional regulator with XRE-family HTH domain
VTTDLDVLVREALAVRKGEWQRIAEAAGVSHSWLSKFFNGHIDNPGFATLKRLHKHLTSEAAAEEAGDVVRS